MALGSYHNLLSKCIGERKTAMIYGYARVSTKGQAKDGNSLEAQEQALRANGAEKVYKDSFTGTKANRPELDKLLDVLESGDTVVVTKLDRIARSAQAGIELVNTITDKGCNINILNMGMVDNTPLGKVVRNMLFAFAEFERDMIVQRTQEGKAIAKQHEGFKEGRPKKFNKDQISHALSLLEDHTYKEVSRITGISEASLYRAVRQDKANKIQAE